MKKLSTFISSSAASRELLLPHLRLHSHLPIRRKSSHTRRPRKSPPPKHLQPKQLTPPSLHQQITDIVFTPPTPTMNTNRHLPTTNNDSSPRDPFPTPRTPSTREIAPQTAFPATPESQQPSITLDEISQMVQKITEIVRSQKPGELKEEHLNELGFEFTPDIVEKVLKRCFRVRGSALWFFNWVKRRPGFRHTTETFNTMIYMAGEAGEFELLERLVGEMDEEMCVRDFKTWTIMVAQYGKARQVGKALLAFGEMRRSGCCVDDGAYRAVLGAVLSSRKSELALEFYGEMVLKGMVVDVSMCGLLMDCLAESGNVEAVRSVGDDMVRIGQVSDGEMYTRMMKSFCVAGRIEDAHKLLEEIKKKMVSIDLEIYEVFVKGLCRAGRVADAVELVDDLKRRMVVNCTIYGFLIDGFLRSSDVSKALELLHGMRAPGSLPMVSSYTQVIQYLFRSGEYEKACEVYEKMVSDGIEPDIVATTAMVAGHVRNNRISEACEVFESMKKKGIRPTWKAYSVFIKELCKVSKSEVAFQLLKEMSDYNINPTDDIFRLVLSSLTRKGELEKAKKVEQICRSYELHSLQPQVPCHLVDRQPPNVVSNCIDDQVVNSTQTIQDYSESDLTELCRILSSSMDWNLMQENLERCKIQFTPELVEAVLRSSQRHGSAALQFFLWVGKQDGYRHTTATYNLGIKISGGGKDFKHMRNLYLDMRRQGCSITPDTWTIMISQYGQAGLTDIALRTFRDMKSDGYQPNFSTYKYLIIFLCGKKGKRIEEAITLFQKMINSGYMPDKEMSEIYLGSLCESGKIEDAKKSTRSLCKRGFTTQLGYSMLIKSLCRAGRVEEALLSADEMEQFGCRKDQYIYGSIVHALLRGGHTDEALHKVEAMKRAGFPLTTHIHTSFIVHFCKEKQIGKAVEIFKKMKQDGCEPTVITYSAMIRGYMNMGMVSDAWNIFNNMKLKGPSPDFETFSMFMTCLCKAGRSEKALQLIHDMLDCGVIPSSINFQTVFHGLNREGKRDLARSVLRTKSDLQRKRKFST